MIGLLILEFSYVLGRLKILSNGLKIYDRNKRYELVCPMCNVCCEDGVYFSFLSCSIQPILVKVGVNFLMILDINLYFFSYVIEEEQCVKSVYSK